jgi:hypothetical protein
MNAKQLRDIVDTAHIDSHKALKESIRRRLETAAHNGLYEITFDTSCYDGPFLLPENARKTFLEELTNDGFVVSCDTRSRFRDHQHRFGTPRFI